MRESYAQCVFERRHLEGNRGMLKRLNCILLKVRVAARNQRSSTSHSITEASPAEQRALWRKHQERITTATRVHH